MPLTTHLLRRAPTHRGLALAARAALPLLAAAAPLAGVASASAATGTITTIVGVGAGDGWPAIDVPIGRPASAVVTGDGGMVFTSADDNRIRRVAPDGTITTIAGGGRYGSGGDGGPAIDARLQGPGMVRIAPDGSIVFVDTGAHSIRKISANGTITTIVGTGDSGVSASSTPIRHAMLQSPRGIAFGPDGALYIAEAGARHIRKVAGGTMTTIAGTGAAGSSGDGGPATAATFQHPASVAVAGDGSILIGDSGAAVIRRIAPNGTIATVAGTGAPGTSGDGGPATAAKLSDPESIAAVPGGGFVFADSTTHQVRRVDASGTIALVAGARSAAGGGDGGPATLANLNGPSDVSLTADGAMIVCDRNALVVRRIGSSGIISTVAGSRIGFPAVTDAPGVRVPVGGLRAMVTTPDGAIVAIDRAHNRIIRVSASGTVTTMPGLRFDEPLPGSAESLHNPSAVALGPNGTLVFGDPWNDKLLQASPLGMVTSLAGAWPGSYASNIPGADAAVSPTAIAVAPDGSIVFNDTSQPLLRRLTPDGRVVTVAGEHTVPGTGGDGGPAASAFVQQPGGLAYGPNGSLYFTDFVAQTIRRIEPSGMVSRVAGIGDDGFSGDGGPALDAALNAPHGIAVAPDGTVVFADAGNQRVRAIDPNGTIRTLAGTGDYGDSGDGGPATRATFLDLSSLAVTADGAVLVGDGQAGRIRRIDAGLVPASATPASAATPNAAVATTAPSPAASPRPPAGLSAAFAATTTRAIAGRPVALRVTSTRAAAVVVRIMRGRRTVATLTGTTTGTAPATLTWVTKRGRRVAPAATYTLSLTATAADGATFTTRGRLILRRPR